MIERDDVQRAASRLDREAVRAVLVEAWRRRPASERGPNVAKRFALDAAKEHPFVSDRPREAVILGWIRPYVVQPAPEREPTALERWLDRPWYRRSHWPLRLIAVAVVTWCVARSFLAFARDEPAVGGQWLFLAMPAAVLAAMVWVERRPGR